MGPGRVGLVLLLVALLGGVAYYYSRMGDKTPRGTKAQLQQMQQLQSQVDNLKTQLKQLVNENQRLKRQGSDLDLRKQELKVAKEDVIRLRKKVDSCQKFADNVDDEKEMGKSKLRITKKNLENERRMTGELQMRIESVSGKLKETKTALSEIEKQKQSSITDFQTQRQKYQQLKRDLADAKAKEQKSGDKTESQKIEKLLSDMNKDLRSKSAVISELTKQKRASDEMLRRLEGKLLEAGVDPRDIARVGKTTASGAEAPKPNPAAAAMMQVGQGSGSYSQQQTGMADIVFQLADDNGDHSLDLEEFTRHVRPSIAQRAKASGRAAYYLQQRFNDLDLDHSGYITKEEAMLKAPILIRYLVSKEEMKIFNGTKTAAEARDESKSDSKEDEPHPEVPKRKGLFSSWGLGQLQSWKSMADMLGFGGKKASDSGAKKGADATTATSGSSTAGSAGRSGSSGSAQALGGRSSRTAGSSNRAGSRPSQMGFSTGSSAGSGSEGSLSGSSPETQSAIRSAFGKQKALAADTSGSTTGGSSMGTGGLASSPGTSTGSSRAGGSSSTGSSGTAGGSSGSSHRSRGDSSSSGASGEGTSTKPSESSGAQSTEGTSGAAAESRLSGKSGQRSRLSDGDATEGTTRESDQGSSRPKSTGESGNRARARLNRRPRLSAEEGASSSSSALSPSEKTEKDNAQ